MALNVTAIQRVFKHGNIELADPSSSLSPDDVLGFYSNTYPELTTANVIGPKIEGSRAVYEFKTVVGTKG